MCFTALCSVKILCFVWFGATSCLLPFLTLHMKASGVPPMASALIGGSLPLFHLVTFPMAFATVKRTSSYKKTAMWFLLLTAASTVLLVFTPRIPSPSRKSIGIHFQCGPAIEPAVITDKCNHQCENHPSLQDGIDVYFTECHVDCPDKTGTFKNAADLCFDDGNSRVCHVVEVNNTLSEKFNFGVYLGRALDDQDTQCRYPMKGVHWHDSYYHLVSCPIILMESHPQCTLRCDLEEIPNSKNPLSLSGLHDCMRETPGTVNSAIWLYFGIRVVFHVCLGVASVLIERAMLHTLKQQQRSRANYITLALISAAVFTPLAGVLIDFNNSSDVVRRYEVIFLLSSSMILASIILETSLELDTTEVPALGTTYKSMLRLVKELEITVLLSVVLLIGAVSGFLDVFLFWYLEDMACTHYVMGATVTASLIVSLPMSSRMIITQVNKLRPGYIICICFLLQSGRCLGYFFMKDFWWCFLIELIGTAAFHLLWTATSRYGKIIASKQYQIAFQTSTGAVHYGLGRSCGAYIGGAVMALYGFRPAFLAFGCASAALAMIYLCAYHFDLRKRPKNLIDFKSGNANGQTENRENTVTLLKISSSVTVISSTTDTDFGSAGRRSESSDTIDEIPASGSDP